MFDNKGSSGHEGSSDNEGSSVREDSSYHEGSETEVDYSSSDDEGGTPRGMTTPTKEALNQDRIPTYYKESPGGTTRTYDEMTPEIEAARNQNITPTVSPIAKKPKGSHIANKLKGGGKKTRNKVKKNKRKSNKKKANKKRRKTRSKRRKRRKTKKKKKNNTK